MALYDFDRPFISQSAMKMFVATDPDVASEFGRTVKAVELSNVEYQARIGRMARENSMKPPPSCGRIFMGWLVIRRFGSKHQYETWMPEHVFEEMYAPAV